MSPLQGAKLWLMQLTGLAKDALHIYVALLVFFGTMLLFRWRIGSWKPVLVVLAAAVVGEAWDLRDSRVYHTGISLAGNWHDVWNTSFWPAAITLLARLTPLFARSGEREQSLEQSPPVDPAVR